MLTQHRTRFAEASARLIQSRPWVLAYLGEAKCAKVDAHKTWLWSTVELGKLAQDELANGRLMIMRLVRILELIKLISKLRELEMRWRMLGGSPMRLEKFKLLTTPVGKKQGLAPLLDARTRWGTTYTMIQRATQCKDAYNSVLIDLNLTDYILDELEWRRFGALMDLLGLFDQSTTQACASKSHRTIAMSIVMYNKLMQEIEDFVERNKERLPDVCLGATAAYNKLKKYYAATDRSPIYSVATALHPAMRFKYWSDQNWGARNDPNELILLDTDIDNTDAELLLLGMTTASKGDQLEEFVTGPLLANPCRTHEVV
ncbi:hypothetical protein KI688_007707 [Linnemannia hyalina]|uniref:Uncharacterized protein n=1 Tax=Linnemannia hyalina TaxID=64524 RepID=A0A9P7XJ53_9FUNG|nr:hypothetical protein KI688_007707 [Linnemannia hyalina]